jgi:hypothetical protein
LAPGDLSDLTEALNADLSGDRARADALARRSAATLRDLARTSNIAEAIDALGTCLTGRPDAVALPAMGALGAAGGADQASALAAVVADAGRSDGARAAAADACAAILSRGTAAGEGVASALESAASSDASLSVRVAAARAIDNLGLGGAARAALLGENRSDAGN